MTAPTVPTEPRWVRAPDALWRSVARGVLLLDGADDPATGAGPVLLTDPGAALWDALARPRTRPELAAGLAARFGADVGVVDADVAGVLDLLIDRRLVVPGPEGDEPDPDELDMATLIDDREPGPGRPTGEGTAP